MVRQLVSVVTDDSVMYLVHDGEQATQIAHVLNVGLDVESVVRLGVNLSDALRLPSATLNGHSNGDSKSAKALPAARPAKTERTPKRDKSGTKESDLVLCQFCATAYRRTSLATHLRSVHNVRHSESLELSKSAEPAPADAPRSTRGGYRGPAIQRELREPPRALWPNLTNDNIVEHIRTHPGSTARDACEALTGGADRRAVKTASNRVSRLVIDGVLRAELVRGSHGATRQLHVVEPVRPVEPVEPVEPVAYSVG